MDKWRVIRNKTYNGAMNMAIDEAIMIAYKEKKVKPTLRFYTWEPVCLTIGYFQKMEEEINLDACKNMNVDCVRRITGGRAVLHENELTYSIIVGEDNPLMDKSINVSYKFISEGLVKGLNLCNIFTDDLNKGERIGRDNLSAACFNAHSSYEITMNKKKVVGSAQNRKNGVILQHGSIVLDFDVDKLFELIKTEDEDKKERLIRFTSRKASGIENESKLKIDITKLEVNLIKAIQSHFRAQFVEEELSEYEINIAKKLYLKYSSDEHNKKR
ncbi:MAG: lipoate--protein ligase family protein [Romboutsia sp.]